jgi:hypothetical protein
MNRTTWLGFAVAAVAVVVLVRITWPTPELVRPAAPAPPRPLPVAPLPVAVAAPVLPDYEAIARDLHREIASKLSISRFTLKKGGYGSLFLIDLHIKNSSVYDVRDLKITCQSFGPSGTAIAVNKKTIFQSFPVGKTKHVYDFDMGYLHPQAARAFCEISDFSL